MDSHYFKELLNSRNLKATNTRLNLLLQLQEYKSAMPYTVIQKEMASIDRVTLYRTIGTLTKRGIIHKAFQEKNETYYAICGKKCGENNHQHDHIHFKCVVCNAVTCEHISNSVDVLMPDYDVHYLSIYAKGVCKLCKK